MSPADAGPATGEEFYVLTSASSRGTLEAAIRASRKTNVTDHLADDERPWADHLRPAEREKLTAHLAAHPDKAPAHLAAHMADVGILTRTGPSGASTDLQADPPESRQP